MSFEHLSSAQLENALADADSCFQTWKTTTVADRAAILKKSCIAAAHQRRWLRATGDTGDGKANSGSSRQGGGFAEYILADPANVAHVPAGLLAIEAVPLSCAGVTSYKGLKETNAKPAQWVAISGIGRLGVLITAPSLAAFKQGVCMTCKRGTCVLVGLTPGESRRRCSMWWRTASRSADSSSAPGKMAEALGFAAAVGDQRWLCPARARRSAVARGDRFPQGLMR